MIVIDTNIIAYLFLESDRSPQVEQVLERDPQWAAPLLWRSEFLNVLAHYIRKTLLSLDEAQQIMREALLLMKGQEYEIPSFQVLDLAASNNCSAYDCEFVALAKDLETRLVTVDKKIVTEFPEISVSLDVFISQ